MLVLRYNAPATICLLLQVNEMIWYSLLIINLVLQNDSPGRSYNKQMYMVKKQNKVERHYNSPKKYIYTKGPFGSFYLEELKFI